MSNDEHFEKAKQARRLAKQTIDPALRDQLLDFAKEHEDQVTINGDDILARSDQLTDDLSAGAPGDSPDKPG